MRFIPGLLLGYYIRSKQRLLIATLTAICHCLFIGLPAIALSQLAWYPLDPNATQTDLKDQ